MKNIIRVFLLICILFGAIVSQPQELSDRDYRRWLIKKPEIKSIEVYITSLKGEDSLFLQPLKVKNSLFSKVDNLFLSLKKDRRRRVQRETLLRDTSAVIYLYLSNGFLNVKVTEEINPILPAKKDTAAQIIIKINEGKQYFYGPSKLSSNYEPRLGREFSKIINRFKRDKPVDPFMLRQATYDMKSVLANNGYPYARANYSIDTTYGGNLAEITFQIESDSLVHFGDVAIVGAHNYDTSLVRREITFKNGDLYRRKDILDSQKRLLSTGYYITMHLDQLKPDTINLIDRLNPHFILNLKEKKPHYVSIKTGAAQDSIKDLIWSAGASWGKRNFLKSRHIELSADAAFVIFTEWRLIENNYRIRLTDPWFLGIRMPLSLTAQFEPGVESIKLPFRKQTWSISATTTKDFGEKIKAILGLQYEQKKIYNIDTAALQDNPEAQIQLENEKGLSIRRKLYLNVVRDSRNSFFVPMKGSLTSFRIEYIGGFLGGGESFYIFESSWARYQKVWPGWISATRLKGGVVQETGDALEVPIDDRFFIGGANTVRGFKETELGPATGSDIILIFNQEFRFPVFGKLWSSLFTDIGNGYRYRTNIKFNNLAISYGVGIQFISPAGPIRLDYARQVKVKGIESDRNYRVHFTILYAF